MIHSTTSDDFPVSSRVPTPRRLHRSKWFTEASLVGVVLVIGLLMTSLGGNLSIRDRATGETRQANKFLRAENLDLITKNTSFFAIMAVGMTFVIITGGIDLSVGAIYCLAAVLGAMFLQHFGPTGTNGPPRVIVPAAILLCLGVGTACGVINGLGVVLLRIHPFIITLGTMAIFRGIAFVMSHAQSFTGFPSAFTDGLIRFQVRHRYFPVPMAIMVAVVMAAGVYLRHFVTGRHIFAIGGNELASRFSGLAVNRIKLLVYALSGLCAGIAAVIMLGYYGSASSDAGKGYELEVIAAAVVGGASLSGGRGTMFGALLGALIIQLINNGIIILNVDQNYSQIIIGTVIIVAVVLERVGTQMRERRMAMLASA